MTVHPTYARQRSSAAVALMLPVSILLAACWAENEPQKTEARPVRTITVETRNAGTPITLPGRIEAEDEVALGFRIAGRILENNTRLGDRLSPARSWRDSSRRPARFLRPGQGGTMHRRRCRFRRATTSNASKRFSSRAGRPAPTSTRRSRPFRPPLAGRRRRSATEDRP